MSVKDIVYEEIKKYTDFEFCDNSLFKEDLCINSYKAVQLMMGLERRGVVFKAGMLPAIKKVSDLIDCLEFKKVNG